MSGYWDVLHAKGGKGRAWDDVFEGRRNAKGGEDEGERDREGSNIEAARVGLSESKCPTGRRVEHVGRYPP